MNDLVGLIRRESEMTTALKELEKYKERVAQVSAEGGTGYNPGWHLALDLRNMLLVAECVAMAALERQESRGGHTRDDFPEMSPEWRKINLMLSMPGDHITLWRQPVISLRPDLLELFEVQRAEEVPDRRGAPRGDRGRSGDGFAQPGGRGRGDGHPGDRPGQHGQPESHARGEALTWVTRQTSRSGGATRARAT